MASLHPEPPKKELKKKEYPSFAKQLKERKRKEKEANAEKPSEPSKSSLSKLINNTKGDIAKILKKTEE